MTMPSQSYYDRQDSRCFSPGIDPDKAAKGSEALRLRIEALFDNYAYRHRITFGQAMVRNLYPGVRV